MSREKKEDGQTDQNERHKESFEIEKANGVSKQRTIKSSPSCLSSAAQIVKPHSPYCLTRTAVRGCNRAKISLGNCVPSSSGNRRTRRERAKKDEKMEVLVKAVGKDRTE